MKLWLSLKEIVFSLVQTINVYNENKLFAKHILKSCISLIIIYYSIKKHIAL